MSTRPGLYIHVPFCRTKCPYCDFYSETSVERVSAWLEAVEREASRRCGEFGAFDTLYIGGGTPSVLSEGEFEGLLERIRRCCAFEEDTETTVEVNPDDVTPGKLRHMRDLGVNRLSIGVQSLDEGELRYLGRRHTAAQAVRAVDAARSAGFDNLGMDLMYGFEGHTEAVWLRTLERAVGLAPEHLSCYQMTLEEGTVFGRRAAEGLIQPLGEELESRLFLLTSEFLERNGYVHYEISNFARGLARVSRHNRKYWHHVSYLGLGPAAHSFRGGVRWWNVRSTERYCDALAGGDLPVEESERLTEEQIRFEKLFLGLRTREGADISLLSDAARREAEALRDSGLIRIEDDRVVPTLKGWLIADRLPTILGD
ncbi:MAG: radical SAM family heme chaperone HemW [Acidobacteriota bacterium]